MKPKYRIGDTVIASQFDDSDKIFSHRIYWDPIMIRLVGNRCIIENITCNEATYHEPNYNIIAANGEDHRAWCFPERALKRAINEKHIRTIERFRCIVSSQTKMFDTLLYKFNKNGI